MIAYLIGSKALEYWGLGSYPDSDYDIVCDPKGMGFWKTVAPKVECHDINDLNNREICERYFDVYANVSYDNDVLFIVSLEGLAAIKRSHLFRDYKWDKHITQYHKLLKSHMTDEAYNFAMDRKRLTIEKFKITNPKLNQSNSEFFDDAVTKKYDHDMLHEMVAYYDRPLYTRLKHEDKTNLAWCERDLWNELPYEDKVKCAAEETFVIAAERFMIPNDWNYPAKRAWYNATKKLCTTLTSGWFRDFSIDNFEQIYNMFDEDKFKDLRSKLERL